MNYVIDKGPVGNLVTKRPAGLDFAIYVRCGSVQLGQVASIGIDPEIAPHKDGLDAVRLRFTNVDQVKSLALRSFLVSQWATFNTAK